MSTPATYRFVARSAHESDQTFYIHHDGYLEGAASYLWSAIDYASEADPESLDCIKDCKGGLAGAFFRANRRAEFASGHDKWGADFQYNIDENLDLVTVKKRCDDGRYSTVATKSITDFVNEHACPQWCEDFSPVASAKIGYVGKEFFTVNNGKKIAEVLEAKAEKYGPSNPNCGSCREQAKAFRLESEDLSAQVG